MKQFRFTVSRKIMLGFFLLILIFSANAVYTFITVNEVTEDTTKSLEYVDPSLDYSKEFINLVIRSKMLITNWVYLQTNDTDKQALNKLHENEYPELKSKLTKLKEQLGAQSNANILDSAFIKFEELLEIQKGIKNELDKFEDYEDPIKKFMAEEQISEQILPKSQELIEMLSNFTAVTQEQKASADIQRIEDLEVLMRTTVVLFVILVIAGIVITISISNSITNPVKSLKKVVDRIGLGELVQAEDQRLTNDEIGDMARSVANMAKGYGDIATFAENIGNGQYDSEFKPLSDKDVLGTSLLEMRDNLKKVADEDKKRNWATSGMAKFGDILRMNNDNFEVLADDIISNLVKYVDANQGALFIIEEDKNESEDYMKMAACYAWNKKKFVDKKVFKGEGLAGQAWIEGSTIYLTEVPDQYVSITSGLGESNPRSILIVPLKINDEIHGVIEIASFGSFEDYQIEFIERISENIASTISSVKVNERTQKLLKESTMMTEQMRAQEEEMRQNMEELQATQEKIQRDQKDREARESLLMQGSMVLEMNESFYVTKANDKVTDVLSMNASEIEGKPIKEILTSSAELGDIKDKATTETVWSGSLELKNKEGKVIEVWGTIGQIPDSIHDGLMYICYLFDVNKN